MYYCIWLQNRLRTVTPGIKDCQYAHIYLILQIIQAVLEVVSAVKQNKTKQKAKVKIKQVSDAHRSKTQLGEMSGNKQHRCATVSQQS